MSTKVQIKLDHLQSLNPRTFVEDPSVRNNFIHMFLQVRSNDEDEAEAFYEKESNYFKRRVFDAPTLLNCTVFSLYSCFMDIVTNGLSFEPAANLVYLEVRSVNAAPFGQKEEWEKRARLIISPYGELAIRIECGQLKYIDQPVVVYDCDMIKIKTNDQGNKVVVYEGTIPRTSKKIIACFVKLIRADGSFDFHYMLEDDIERLSGYSNRQNKDKGANALYKSADGGVDPGFLIAKTIKHAFKTFPKVKIKGTNSELDDHAEPGTTAVNVIEEHSAPAGRTAPVQQPANNESFSPTPVAEPVGLVVEDDTF